MNKRKDSQRDDPHLETQLGPLPAELDEELQELERLFNVDAAKLKEISLQFEHELRQGLEREGGNIPMNVTWVLGWPTGQERGEYLTLDLGGTNLRVCWIILQEGKGKTEVKQKGFPIPDKYKSGEAEPLWNFIAESIALFIDENKLQGTKDKPLPLGFTFSYPATQEYIDHGVLQTWTKGFDIKGVEGHDVVESLNAAMAKKDLPVHLVALINDTTGAMIASAYNDPETIVGAIFGTGCNAAYMEDCGSIPKISGLNTDQPMAINCEYGAFDNELVVLPRTKYDEIIDAESPRPGEQAFEKMSAGLYLGEIFRRVLLDVQKRGLIFHGQDLSKLEEAYSLDTGFLSSVENDKSELMSETRTSFKKQFGLETSDEELLFLRRLGEFIAIRGARLCTTGIGAICRKKNITKGHVAADGSVANKHPKFKERWARAMSELLDWDPNRKEDPIIITSAEDGSGMGAAVISAMTLQRIKDGDYRGTRQQES